LTTCETAPWELCWHSTRRLKQLGHRRRCVDVVLGWRQSLTAMKLRGLLYAECASCIHA
jgi:hypothetical protein